MCSGGEKRADEKSGKKGAGVLGGRLMRGWGREGEGEEGKEKAAGGRENVSGGERETERMKEEAVEKDLWAEKMRGEGIAETYE